MAEEALEELFGVFVDFFVTGEDLFEVLDEFGSLFAFECVVSLFLFVTQFLVGDHVLNVLECRLQVGDNLHLAVDYVAMFVEELLVGGPSLDELLLGLLHCH